MMGTRPLQPIDLRAAAAVVAASHVDDPAMAWVFPNSRRREQPLFRLFGLALGDVLRAGRVDVAHEDGEIVGVAAWLPPGGFPVPWRRQLASAPAFGRLAVATPTTVPRLLRFLAASTAAFPAEPCWLLDVVGIHPSWQGRGVGTALLAARMGDVAEHLHLETWRERNLAFYARFGFEVAGTDTPLGSVGPRRWTLRHPSTRLGALGSS